MKRMRKASCHNRFTLIELLIVVAIIAILAALLLPALGRVKYQAKLVSCMSNQKQVATALFLYASSHNNRHIDRSRLLKDTRGYPSPYSIKELGVTNPFDERDYLAEHVPFEALQCPFHQQFDYMSSTSDHIRGNYSFFGGWMLMPDESQMKKLSDRMTLAGSEFDVLVADATIYYGDRPFVQASHSDIGFGAMKLNSRQDSTLTVSLYSLGGSLGRGPLDLNFAFADGSVTTIRNIKSQNDPQVKQVSYKYGNDGKPVSTRWSLLPESD